jgi:CubicO group peptidase (beta-lactamase class C family)
MVALTAPIFACAAPPAGLETGLQQWLGDEPGGVAAAWIDADGVTYFNAGHLAKGDSPAVTADTQFEIGSLTKVFTGLLLADSVGAGKVGYGSPVGPPFATSKITYAQLVTHTSGLPRLPADFTPSDPLNPYAEQNLAHLEKSFELSAATARPSPTAYSNFGFAVLGQSLAGAWGQPYTALLRDRVLRPLGLPDTLTSWRGADKTRLAQGFNETGAAPNWDLAAYAPAGALVSSARDLGRFVQENLGLVSTPLAPALAEAIVPRVAGDMPAREVGLAWQVEKRGDDEIIWHNGGTGGYRSFLAFNPKKKTGVVLLTNHTRGLDSLGFALLAGKIPPPAKATPGPSDAAKEFLGNYPLAPSFVMAVTAEGDQLSVQATGQPRIAMRRLAADHYSLEGVDAEISFERDAGGKVVALVLHQGGLNQRAPRRAPGEEPASPREITLPAELLAEYSGRFRLGSAEFTVSVEHGRLMVQLTGQGKYQVYATARDEFFYKVVNAQLSFVRDASGKVVALILHQGGRDQRTEKE